MRRPTTERLTRLLALVLVVSLALFALVGIAGCSCEDDPDATADEQAADGDDGADLDSEAGGDADADVGAGDDDDDDEEGDEDGDPITVYLWFSYGGDRALRIERTIDHTEAVGSATMEALLDGPTADELATWPVLATNIPDGTDLLGLTITDGVATVDLSEEFDDGGGTFSVTARLAEVVYTLCQFDSVDSVLFKIEGEVVEMFSSEGLMLDGEPQTPDDYDDLIPVDA